MHKCRLLKHQSFLLLHRSNRRIFAVIYYPTIRWNAFEADVAVFKSLHPCEERAKVKLQSRVDDGMSYSNVRIHYFDVSRDVLGGLESVENQTVGKRAGVSPTLFFSPKQQRRHCLSKRVFRRGFLA